GTSLDRVDRPNSRPPGLAGSTWVRSRTLPDWVVLFRRSWSRILRGSVAGFGLQCARNGYIAGVSAFQARRHCYVRTTVSCAADRAGVSVVAAGSWRLAADVQQQGPHPPRLHAPSRVSNLHVAFSSGERDGRDCADVERDVVSCGSRPGT